MNINGEYLRVKQLSDGNFLAVGTAQQPEREDLDCRYYIIQHQVMQEQDLITLKYFQGH